MLLPRMQRMNRPGNAPSPSLRKPSEAASPHASESSNSNPNPSKELYQRLRKIPCESLWRNEVPAFNQASPRDRTSNVAVIRALGVTAASQAAPELKSAIRQWLRGLLKDPDEKVRRYAMNALPKVESGPEEESAILELLRASQSPREQAVAQEVLSLIGGRATLEALASPAASTPTHLVQRVKASVARETQESSIRRDRPLSNLPGLRVHLRGRHGLETILKGEVDEFNRVRGLFRTGMVLPGIVALHPGARFALDDLYSLRCFSTVGFVLGQVNDTHDDESRIEAIATTAASPLALQILRSLTFGPIRYRLEFHGDWQRKQWVQRIADRIYAVCPELLNDPHQAPWTLHVYPQRGGFSLELSPKVLPDPRWHYRLDDIPAASHPPLAASLARVSGRLPNERVWDPFCGSGLELVERCLLGGVREVYGSDLSAEAIAIAEANFAAANLRGVLPHFGCADFREVPQRARIEPNSLTLVLTNPPMGRRVQVGSLRGLIRDLLQVSAEVLCPGGRLIFPNPLRLENPHPDLRLQYRQTVDMGGFECAIEKYVKLPPKAEATVTPKAAPGNRPISRRPGA